MPRTRAYYEIFLDEEPIAGGEEEPIYGPTYLPRKFKIAVAVPPLNDVDVFAHDLGFIAIVEQGRLAGFNVVVGGGMGASHGEKETFPRVGDVIGFVSPERLLAVAEGVVVVQRDFGDRMNRKHARLKYTIEDRGLPWFVEELERRLDFAIGAPRPYRFEHNGDRFGWTEGHDGRFHLGLHVESGRLAGAALDGLRELARIHEGDFRLTPNQNLIVAGVPPSERARIEAIVEAHGLDGHRRSTPLKRLALACVSLPTCGLAMAEAERYLPAFVHRFEELLARHALREEAITLRITGCPNGCARPYLAEVALVGKAPGRYNLMLGGDARGERLNRLHRENVDEGAILAELDALLGRYAREREANEGFGDFVVRTGDAG
jgi:sulfite reductase (NADPH) hemoprotein beta-component